MHRTSTPEPRYKHSLYEREPRHVESNEFSEEDTSSSEEEEESSGKYTEESDEETTESQESYSLQKRSEWSPAFEQQWSYNKLDKPGKNNKNPYICNTRIHKQDKVTQKNLLSPFPSFLIPPIPRQVIGPPNYRLPNVRPPKEEQYILKNATKYSPKKRKNYREMEGETLATNKNLDDKERKMFQKAEVQKDQACQSKVGSSDRVLKCLYRESPEESFRNFLKSTAQVERFSKKSTPDSKSIQHPKSSIREDMNNQQMMTKFPDYTPEHETGEKSRLKTSVGVTPSEKDACIREAFLARNVGDGKLANKKDGELKEKLVYVVEEEGKEVTKLETDLFTLNEILAIKRDLLELSEFAKKLKKLKEMKKESESTKNKENKCQCKPAEELLKDVSRRIEILETRQEELERGNNRTGQKGDTETESKNTNVTKISSDLQSKTPAVQSSATTTDPSFPKRKIFVASPEGSSNYSDIVKELMDIKTQLQRLEKRRLSKEVSDEVALEGSTKLTANKNRPIAVFSSKTYIFAAKNSDKEKIGEKMKKEEKEKNRVSSVERNTTKSQRKADVASWLKNVKVQQTETDVNMFLSEEGLKRKKNDLEGPKENSNMKCRNCVEALKMKDLENQEPQKNRVLERNGRKGDNSFAELLKNESSISEINGYVGCNKCMTSPSGRLFVLMSGPNEKVLNIPSACKLKPSSGTNPQWLPPRIISRSISNESITSAILAKQKIRKWKAQITDKYCKGLNLRPSSQSRSLQGRDLNSSFCKVENTAMNMNVKNFEKSEGVPLPKAKKNKEDKNEFARYLEAHLMALQKNFEKRDLTTSSCTYSEFLASINLESEGTPATIECNTLEKSNANNEIYTYMASTKTNLKVLDSQSRQEKNYKERKKNEKKKMQGKEEKKNKKKSELKKKSKPKKEKKCKESTKEKKCKKKKKKEQHHCKCKNTNYSDFWKNYYRDDCFMYKEKKATYDHSKIPNEDNLKIYMKRQTERSNTNLDCQKSVPDTFTIRNIFKYLGRYYPKISNFHLFPLPRGEKQEEDTKSRHSKTRITSESKEQKNEDEYDDEDDEDEDCNEISDSSYAIHSKGLSDQEYHRFYHHISNTNDLKNCRCVQVYLQTQEQLGWSGLRPFRALSVENITNESISRSTESYRSRKSKSLFPVRKSYIHCVGHSTKICEEKQPKCDKKLKCNKKPECDERPKCGRKSKKEKKHKRKHCNVCVCCKCGHSHRSKKKKRKKPKCCHECRNEDKSESLTETQECSDSEFMKHCSCCEKPPGETVPLFSFFSNFCRTKPREKKFSKSITNKFNEIRCLKTCPKIQSNFFSKLRNRLPMSCDQKSLSKRNFCHCISRVEDIESKLKKFEKKKSCCNHCQKKKEREKNKKREREQKEERERERRRERKKKEERERERRRERKKKEEREREKKEERKREKKKEREREKKRERKYEKRRERERKEERKREKRQEREKKKERKKKKKCYCSESCSSDSAQCLCCKDEEKKKVKRCKEKEQKKCKTECCCPESKDGQKFSAYYCTVEYLSSSTTREAFKRETTEKEKKEKFPCTIRSKEQTNTRLKKKLPFLTSFWEEVQNYKVKNSQSRIKNLMKIKNKKPASLFEPGMFLGEQSKEESKLGGNRRSNDFFKKGNKSKTWRKETEEKEKKKRKAAEAEAQEWKLKVTTLP